IVSDLRAFPRAEDLEPRPVSLSEVASSAVSLGGIQLRQGVTFELRLDDVPPVLASPGRLGQIFLNLFLNAAQATTRRTEALPIVTVRVEASRHGEQVLVRVTDDGDGIPSELHPQLFSPFFTTKPVGEGTGLGLYVSRDIVRSFGGELRLESSSEAGSTFLLTLPAAT
ncbi:MAG: sensor histidine kinase, partial [Gammaproteobacteria bacterium]